MEILVGFIFGAVVMAVVDFFYVMKKFKNGDWIRPSEELGSHYKRW